MPKLSADGNVFAYICFIRPQLCLVRANRTQAQPTKPNGSQLHAKAALAGACARAQRSALEQMLVRCFAHTRYAVGSVRLRPQGNPMAAVAGPWPRPRLPDPGGQSSRPLTEWHWQAAEGGLSPRLMQPGRPQLGAQSAGSCEDRSPPRFSRIAHSGLHATKARSCGMELPDDGEVHAARRRT